MSIIGCGIYGAIHDAAVTSQLLFEAVLGIPPGPTCGSAMLGKPNHYGQSVSNKIDGCVFFLFILIISSYRSVPDALDRVKYVAAP